MREKQVGSISGTRLSESVQFWKIWDQELFTTERKQVPVKFFVSHTRFAHQFTSVLQSNAAPLILEDEVG